MSRAPRRPVPPPPAAPGDAAAAFLARAGAAIALAAFAAELAGATLLRERGWSVHAWAFLPVAAFAAAALLVAAGLLATWRSPAALERALVRFLPSAAPLRGWPGRGLAAVLAGAVFWALREGHTMLGDGSQLVRNLPAGQGFHPDEPLTFALHHAFFVAAGGAFAGAGAAIDEVVRATVGLSSVLCGAIFVPVAWALANAVTSAPAARAGEGARAARASALLAFAVLAGQGYVQLFFGYVENYTFLALALALYALAALRALERRMPLVVPGGLLLLAIALHLSAVLVAPSFAVLAVVRLADARSRAAAVRDLVATAALAAAIEWGLGRWSPGYDWLGTLFTLGGRPYFPPSPAQFLQQQLQIGPVALAVLLAALVASAIRRGWRHARPVFLAALVPGYVFAAYLAGDSNLGQARNWDLMAPAGFVFTVAALGLAAEAEWSPAGLRRWLFALALASLFHTVPWVLVNASAERTLERFKILPLGLGRAPVLVADWYAAHGREDEALAWYRRALDENPLQNHAHSQLGRIALHRGRPDVAEQAFRAALRSRPTMALYRFQLVDALVRMGRLEPARAELDTLLALEPAVAGYRAASALLWAGLGRADSAGVELTRAERLAPGDTLAVFLRGTIASGDRAAARDAWPRVVAY